MPALVHRLVLAAAVAMIGACQAQPAAAPSKDTLGAAAAKVEGLIGDARCDSPADCRTIARGEKACGGPLSYSAWSTKVSDPKALEAAVAQERALVQAANQRSGMVSNCMMLVDPGARCEQQRCITGGTPAALPR
jgi:hypothetical protein